MNSSKEISCQILHRWTFSSLVGAFLDISLAFFSLCGASSAFLATKFLDLFSQRLPCPCQGLFGRPNGQCLTEILAHYSPKKISNLRTDLKRRFPFNVDEDDCCRFSDWKDRMMTPRSGSVSSWNRDFEDSPIMIEGEDRSLGSGRDLRERRCNLSPELKKCQQNPNRSPVVFDVGSMNLNEFNESETSAIRILERALEEEQAACSSLYLELEKERNAAATAADEAMAMILRLQKEKASIEMEARQFERIVEERTAYDEEEMNILKEIIIRREQENHVLEREIEFYRQVVISGDGLQQQPVLEYPTEDRMQNSENLAISKCSKSDDEKDECCLSPFCDSPKIHGQNDLGTDDISLSKTGVSLSKTGNPDSDHLRKIEQDMDVETTSVTEISKESDPSICDAIFESNGPRKVDRMRRYSGSACFEAERSVRKSISGSRRPLLQVNMSCDSFALSKFRRNSMSAVDKERSKLEAEVESLRDRLKTIQNGREKLEFSENKEKENCHLNLLEEIVSQLCAIRKIASTGKALNQADWKRRQSPSIS